jgi:hypothetical protein
MHQRQILKWRVLYLFILVALFIAGCSHNTEPKKGSSDLNNLYPIKVGDKYGYIDRAGKVIIEPKYGTAQAFVDGVGLVVSKDTRNWAMIDARGKILTKPNVTPMQVSEGMVVAFEGDRNNAKWGFLNTKGDAAIDFKFDQCLVFSEGLAVVYIDNKFGYIDKSGNYVIEPKYDWAYPFHEGLARIEPKRDDKKWGFIDKQDNFVIEPQYSMAGNFSEGLAFAASNLNQEAMFIKPDGSTAFKVDNYVIDLDSAFSDGLCRVQRAKYGFIDTNGKLVIDLKYDEAEDFSEGLAAVKLKDKWGFIDKKGNFVLGPMFTYADSYKDGIAEVGLDGKNAYIDKTGKYIWGPE